MKSANPGDLTGVRFESIGAPVGPTERPSLRPGSLLDIWIYEPDQEDEATEGHSLMQLGARRERSRSPAPAMESDQQLIHTFRMPTGHRTLTVSNRPGNHIAEETARVWRIDEPITLHEVRAPPADLNDAAATFLIEGPGDHAHQVNPDDSLILVDIWIVESQANTEVIKIRRTMWTRRRMRYVDFLHLLCAAEICGEAGSLCHLWINKIWWNPADTDIKVIDSGDYVHLMVRGPPMMTTDLAFRILQRQEIADSNRHLYDTTI